MATSPKTSRKQPPLDLTIPENRLVVEIQNRRAKGLAKYGVGMERKDLTHRQWLQHAKEEALDLAVYLEKCIEQEDAKTVSKQIYVHPNMLMKVSTKQPVPRTAGRI